MDVPGYFDFVGEMGALRVVDSAVLARSSFWFNGRHGKPDYCESHVIPRMIFINQMDREMPTSPRSWN